MIGTLLKPDVPPMLKKLRDAARNYPCVLCGKHNIHTVPAHCNELNHFPREFGWLIGKGLGTKSPHYLIAYVCGDQGGCHDKIDGRAGNLTREERHNMWCVAYVRTVIIWFLDGLIRVL